VRDVKLTQKQKRALYMRKVDGGRRGRYGSIEAFSELNDLARRLKMAGAANVEISNLMGVSQTTVSNWVRGIELSAEQKKDLVFRSQSLRYCKERLRFQEEGRQLARKMEALHSQGCMLYWAEGNNYVGNHSAGFTSSNPKMVALFLAFIRHYWDVPEKKMRMRLAYYTGNGVKEDEIIKFWLEVTGLGHENMRKHQVNVVPKSSKGRRKGKLPYGVCHLGINDFRISEHIKGAIAEYVKQSNPEMDTCTIEEVGVARAEEQIEGFRKMIQSAKQAPEEVSTLT